MRLLQSTIHNVRANPFKLTTLLLCLLGLALLIITAPEPNLPHGADADLARNISTRVEVPLLGKVDARTYSLPVLSVVLGLADGFNPCAMWVLVYLISLIVSLNEPKKIWLLVGTFVGASGILYFLLMTAWLNAFLLLGYIRHLTLVVGFFALWVGINNLYETIKNWGRDPACELTDTEEKQKTVGRIKRIVLAPITIGGILAMIGLAFLVNSVEFFCSAAIPAVYTHVLAISGLNTLQYYLYMLIYIFFFMLDDLVVFITAALTVNSSLGMKYARYSQPVGGIVMLGLGVVLIFFPTMLR